jgi:hypothetical protein
MKEWVMTGDRGSWRELVEEARGYVSISARADRGII